MSTLHDDLRCLFQAFAQMSMDFEPEGEVMESHAVNTWTGESLWLPCGLTETDGGLVHACSGGTYFTVDRASIELQSGSSSAPTSVHSSDPADSGLVQVMPASSAAPNSFQKASLSTWEIPFNDLELGKILGRGSFSIVSQANWRGEDCAVKLLIPNAGDEADQLASLIEEANINVDLAHANIVKFHGLCTEQPNLCLIMEFIDGGSLASRLKKGTLEAATMVEWAIQVREIKHPL